MLGCPLKVKGLTDIDRLACVRLSSIEPTTIEEEPLNEMAHGSTLCPYLHIPLQGGKNLHNPVIGVSISGTQRSHHATHIVHIGEALTKGGVMKKTGIWIDHRRAVIVTIDNGNETMQVVEGDIDRQHKAAGRRGTPTPYGPQVPVNEHRFENNFKRHVMSFYKAVIKAIGKTDQLFVMGPAQAKHEFAGEVEKVPDLRNVPLKVETADSMTDPQVAAKVRATEF